MSENVNEAMNNLQNTFWTQYSSFGRSARTRGRETEADRILHMISGDQDWVVLPHNILTILFQDNSKPVSPLSFKKHGFNLSLTEFYVY